MKSAGTSDSTGRTIRLQKFLADAGVGSRRACERWIAEGRVRVNGKVHREMGTKVDPGRDGVDFDGRTVRPARIRHYLAMNKPPGVLCSRSDPAGRTLIGNCLPPRFQNVYPVGRLDYHSEGLIFLTNDGQFCLRVSHPRNGVVKRYRVSVAGQLTGDGLERMRRGVRDHGEKLVPVKVDLVRSGSVRTEIEVWLGEGKNREIRRLARRIGLTVKRIRRIQIGSVVLGNMKPGEWRHLSRAEIESFGKS